jgi:hypothetical protein
MSAPLLIATSLAPGKRADVQTAAVASWRKLGCAIWSFNATDEIVHLAPAYPEIVFVEPPRTARVPAGRPLIYVCDMLDRLRAAGAQAIGLVNSDILIEGPADLGARLVGAAQGSLVAATRVEIDSLAARTGDRNLSGFDAFFLDPALAPLFVDHGFCLGMPYWDYWLPLTVALNRLPLKRIEGDIVFHLRHEESWGDSRTIYGQKLMDTIQAELRRAQTTGAQGATPLDEFLEGFLALYYRKIVARAQDMASPNLPPHERFHVAAQLVEFLDALHETTFLYLRHAARPETFV